MAIKLSGLNSGMDTESIIQELVKAKSAKKIKLEGDQKKLGWKQEAWKDLNSKIYGLYSKTLSNMRLSSDYTKKVTKSSSSAVTVLTGEQAPNCVQTLKIKSMAKSGYLTGAELKSESEPYTSSTKVKDILGTSEDVSFFIQSGDDRKEIKISDKTTIKDVLTTMREVGVNANFDEVNQRFFISAKETGAQKDFALTADTIDGLEAMAKLGIASSLDDDANTKALYEEYKDAIVKNDDGSINEEEVLNKRQSFIDAVIAERIKEAETKLTEANAKITEFEKEKADKIAELDEGADDFADKKSKIAKEYSEKIAEQQAVIDEVNAYYVPADEGSEATLTDSAISEIKQQQLDMVKNASVMIDWYEKAEKDGKLKGIRIEGSDCEIEVKGAIYTSNRNSFEINGLTITVNNMTDEEISLSTMDDSDGIYDMIKNFIKEYNTLINEMDKLYNADSASKYTMLTDEEREALSEDDAKEWDEKIKSALLRRDSTLGTVFDSMKMIMLQGVTMSDGSTKYLSDFGINTLGYFNAEEFEKNAYHIDGDADDSTVSNNTDKLKAAINANPTLVAEFFSKLSRNLYERLDDLMARTELSSAFTVYNDKSLQEEYNKYKDKIADQEEKIADFEDRYYDQFTQMEVAMSKLQSQQNAISSLFA